MASFIGFVDLEDRLVAPVLVRDDQLQAIDADRPPTFRIYGPASGRIAYMGISGTTVRLDMAGLYSYQAPIQGSAGFAAGSTYFVLISGVISGVPFGTLQVFIVN